MADDARRYACQQRLPEFAGAGQARLRAARVVVAVGAAREAEAWALTYLAGGGVGTLVLAGDVDGLVGAAESLGHPLLHATDAGSRRGAAMATRLAARGARVELDAAATPTCALDDDAAPALARGAAAAARLLPRLAAP